MVSGKVFMKHYFNSIFSMRFVLLRVHDHSERFKTIVLVSHSASSTETFKAMMDILASFRASNTYQRNSLKSEISYKYIYFFLVT